MLKTSFKVDGRQIKSLQHHNSYKIYSLVILSTKKKMEDYIIHVLSKSVKNNSHDISGIYSNTQLLLPIPGECINVFRTPSPGSAGT